MKTPVVEMVLSIRVSPAECRAHSVPTAIDEPTAVVLARLRRRPPRHAVEVINVLTISLRASDCRNAYWVSRPQAQPRAA